MPGIRVRRLRTQDPSRAAIRCLVDIDASEQQARPNVAERRATLAHDLRERRKVRSIRSERRGGKMLWQMSAVANTHDGSGHSRLIQNVLDCDRCDVYAVLGGYLRHHIEQRLE